MNATPSGRSVWQRSHRVWPTGESRLWRPWNPLLDTSTSISLPPAGRFHRRARNHSSDATRDGSAGSVRARNAAPNARLVTWFTDRSRSAIISSRFRKLRPNRRYQRTHKRIISASKCRPRNAAGRDRCMNCQRIRPPHPALQHFRFGQSTIPLIPILATAPPYCVRRQFLNTLLQMKLPHDQKHTRK